MAKKSPAATQDRITRDDLEAKFRGLQEGVQGSVEAKKQHDPHRGRGGRRRAARPLLPARSSQRQEEEDLRRDPAALTVARAARRRTSMMSPLLYAGRAAVNRGFLGGSPGWRAFGVVYFGLKFVRRAFGKTPRWSSIEELKRGADGQHHRHRPEDAAPPFVIRRTR